MPTFCRGWGTLPFDRSGPDLTAHALAAWVAWRDRLPPEFQSRVRRAIDSAIQYLRLAQRNDGAWLPLWFGNEFVEGESNPTYGTARVVAALGQTQAAGFDAVSGMAAKARRWLLSSQNDDGGWGGSAGAPSSIEETGLALEALAGGATEMEPALERGARWLVERTCKGTETTASPIGFYFAKLWYFEKLYPLIFALSGLAQLKQRF
jgi:squalene-hopene/tetraprenyl-beta-curcumene cyclase